MSLLELACLGIVALYLGVRLARLRDARGERARSSDRAALRWRLGALFAASWIGEDTVIRAYDLYAYAPSWHLFLDRVPLCIVVIWPIVIDSAWALGARLVPWGSAPVRLALVTAAIVLVDASLIEPIAVTAGLWTWTAPGIFGVPLIGILGWSVFTFFAVLLLARSDTPPPSRALATVAMAPACTHLVLVGLWWSLFRWTTSPIADWTVAVSAWIVLAPLSRTLWRRAQPVDRMDLWVRVPATGFFAVLLAPHARAVLPLLLYALAFVPPYLVLLARGRPLPEAAQ